MWTLIHTIPGYAEKIRVLPDLILKKKKELGLLMLERSATKGFHIVFRRHPLLSQEENLKWASDLLGVPYDKNAKDITRVFFATTDEPDELLYLDDELFLNSPLLIQENGKKSESEDAVPAVNEPAEAKGDVPDRSDIPLTYKGFTYGEIISKYWEMYNDGKEPCAADHNREVLTFELAANIRAICDYDLDTLKAVIPQYDGMGTDEWLKALNDALGRERTGMPYRITQVLNAMKRDMLAKAVGGTLQTPPQRPEKLPPVLAHLTKNTPEMYKNAVCDGVFPALATHLHGVRCRYIDNVEHEATLMNVLVGRQSVGKSCIKKPIEYILEDIKERDKENRAREAEWKRKNPYGSGKKREPRPKDICIQVLTDNLTDACFNQRVIDADANGQRYLYTIVDEVEALKNLTSSKKADEVFLLIREAWDNASHGQERVGSDSVDGNAPLRFNFNASTTPASAQRFFKAAVNNGTLGRLNITTIIRDEDDDEDPVYGIYDDTYRAKLQPYLKLLDSACGLIECPEADALARRIKDDNKMYASLSGSEAFKTFSYRANVIGYLKAIVLFITNGYKWSKEIEDYVYWSVQMDLWCKMHYFGDQLEHELEQENKAFSPGPQDILALLPDEFSKEDYNKIRLQLGKKVLKDDSTLRAWKKRGYIELDDITQTYHKTDFYLNRKRA